MLCCMLQLGFMIDLIVILCSVRPAPVQPGNTGDHGKCGTQPSGTRTGLSEVFGYTVSADSRLTLALFGSCCSNIFA